MIPFCFITNSTECSGRERCLTKVAILIPFPLFLSRLEGSLLPESDSMETFVYVPDLTSQGIPVKENQSLVGYKYFSEQDFNGGKVRGFPDWFIVDSGDTSRYNLTDLME